MKMKKLVMKLFKIPDIDSVLTKERNITNKKIAKLKKEINRNRKEIKCLRLDVIKLGEEAIEIGRFLYSKMELEKHFVQNGHDPKGPKCDICKGRELGILDYRESLFNIIHKRDGLLKMTNTGQNLLGIVNEN